MKKSFLLSIIAILLLVSCGRSWSWADYMAIHKDGIRKLMPSGQMNARYSEVDNFIVHFGSGKQPMEWQTVAFIEGRFVLTYVQPVTVDYSSRTITQAGEPMFQLNAAKDISISSAGTTSTTYDTKLDRKFRKADWDKFVSSGYDLASLGIPKDEIRPIPGWKEYVYRWRKDRVPIQ